MHTGSVSTCKGPWQAIPSKGNVGDQQIQHTPRFPVGLTQAKHFINSEQPWQEAFSLSFIPKKELHLWDPIDSHSPLTICLTQHRPCSWDLLREGWGRHLYTVLFFPPFFNQRKKTGKENKERGGGGEPIDPSSLLLGFLLYLPGCQMLWHSLHVSVLLQKLEEERETEKLHCTVPVDKVQSRQRCLRNTCSLSLSPCYKGKKKS